MSATGKLRLARGAWMIAITGMVTAWSALYLMEQNNPNGIVILDQLGPGYRAYWVLTFAAFLFFLISIALRRHVLLARQAVNEVAAKNLLDDLRTGTGRENRRFFVYLRAFETTGHLKPPFFFTLTVLQRLQTNELESFLALALQKKEPLVGLGQPGENVGAARIRVEDSDWKADIQRLLRQATGVLLVPSAHDGTRWEIEFLQKEGLLRKTVLIMPPRTHQFDWRTRWQQAAEALKQSSITLPEYNKRGLLFTLDAHGGVVNARMFSLFYRRSIRKSIEALLAPATTVKSGEKVIEKANRRSRIVWFYGRWVTVASSLICFPMFFWIGMSSVLSGHAARGVDPPPGWSTLLARYDSASEIGSGQSLVDTEVLIVSRHALPESQIDRLANRGLARVSDSVREMYLLGLGELASHASDEASCSELVRGQSSELGRTRTLVEMPDSHVRLWMQARQSAAFAELRQDPVVVPAGDLSPELKEAIGAVLGRDVTPDLERSLTAQRTLTDKQVCDMVVAGGLTLYRLQEPYRAQFAALLARRATAQNPVNVHMQ